MQDAYSLQETLIEATTDRQNLAMMYIQNKSVSTVSVTAVVVLLQSKNVVIGGKNILTAQKVVDKEKITNKKAHVLFTHQFVLLQVQPLQLPASFSQSHHAVVGDTVALTQMDVL